MSVADQGKLEACFFETSLSLFSPLIPIISGRQRVFSLSSGILFWKRGGEVAIILFRHLLCCKARKEKLVYPFVHVLWCVVLQIS